MDSYRLQDAGPFSFSFFLRAAIRILLALGDKARAKEGRVAYVVHFLGGFSDQTFKSIKKAISRSWHIGTVVTSPSALPVMHDAGLCAAHAETRKLHFCCFVYPCARFWVSCRRSSSSGFGGLTTGNSRYPTTSKLVFNNQARHIHQRH